MWRLFVSCEWRHQTAVWSWTRVFFVQQYWPYLLTLRGKLAEEGMLNEDICLDTKATTQRSDTWKTKVQPCLLFSVCVAFLFVYSRCVAAFIVLGTTRDSVLPYSKNASLVFHTNVLLISLNLIVIRIESAEIGSLIVSPEPAWQSFQLWESKHLWVHCKEKLLKFPAIVPECTKKYTPSFVWGGFMVLNMVVLKPMSGVLATFIQKA